MIMLRPKIKVFLAASLAASLMTMSSCSKIDDFGNMNTNPTVPLTPLTSALLTQTLSNVGSSYAWDQGGISTVSGLYCQYFSETQYTDASAQYSKPTFNWDGYYAGNLKDLQTIIDYNSDPNTAAIALANGSNANQIAIARILKSYIMWFITDTWGDVPYNDIFNADANGVIPYTSQQQIYSSLFTELSEAVAQFDDGPAVKGDILFDGDITMWKKFANSLHALMALRLSKKDATTGAAEFNAALNADGGVFEEGESATMDYPGGNFNSPVYNYYNIIARKDYAVTDVLIDGLYNNYDDRYYVFGTGEGATGTVAGQVITGFPFGLTRDDAIDFLNNHASFARVVGSSKTIFTDGTDFNVSTSPVVLLSSSEVYLARAEAAYLGWTGDDVNDMYTTGIRENWKQWDIYAGELQGIFGGGALNGEDYDYYISQDNIALGTETGDDYAKIAYEEWVAHYPKGWMGFADWRRTGYPELTPSVNSSLGGIPRRMPYGPNEYSLNPTNVASSASQYTGGSQSSDSQLGRVWWDAQ
ncbi:SusD/RagB family nutrient-binding outer membrane lipoprotein [Panacibacter ginsenosidivorans]|uniref:SusD/RagB family nutrient-binding outer membrane lipoprotein n=2 Tax=Panacibacter ginsenosidivorans TaxID=1813871 RepID=A0A5B8V822_9BACT|nr:SusD/RagB family nutrient-binding outer membrane lipoprotein [Panacibacter ginsenosidivorans]